MRTSVIGYPRVGALRELKFASEKYFKKELSADELQAKTRNLRNTHWNTQKNHRTDFIPSNDFSFYDTVLDTAVLLNAIPARYRNLALTLLNTYFAMARGYQGPNGDVKALAMKKWFNTNYHYMVPEIDDNTEIRLEENKPFDEFEEAGKLGIKNKPVLIGAFTFLKLARFTGEKRKKDFTDAVNFDGMGMDFIEGRKSLELVKTNGFPSSKMLFACIVNGKNIWKNYYRKSFDIISELQKHCSHVVLGTSCWLLHSALFTCSNGVISRLPLFNCFLTKSVISICPG